VATLADLLAEHLRALVEQGDGQTEVRRIELAARFACAPSQVNYVLQSRFSPANGYIVESRRGGGGYIRIHRIRREHMAPYLGCLEDTADSIDQDQAETVIEALRRAAVLTEREAAILSSIVRREHLAIALPERDRLRARILRAAFAALWEPAERGEANGV
jgi:transcriptional regulator CtsR